MAKAPNLKQCVGKRILAGGERIYQFSTGKQVGVTRRKCIGVVEKIEGDKVHVFDAKNPPGYRHYALRVDDFLKWVQEKLYVLR